MEPSEIKVSVVIRTKNEEKNIGKTLKQVSAQSYQGGYEIIIVDSGSSDRTAQIAADFALRFYKINREPFSYGFALNFGQSIAAGEIIVFLSAHCIPEGTNWLLNLVAPLIKDKQAKAVYGKQLPIKGMNPIEEFELGIFFPEDNSTPKAIFSNANCAIRKEILKEYPFNEEISYGEDFLWRKKLPLGANVIYAPEAAVFHSHPSSWGYWAGHHQKIGMAAQYLREIEGVDDFYARKGSWWRKILSRFPYLFFFIRQGYFKAFCIFPFLEILRSIFYLKGLKMGKEKYQKP